MPLRLLLQIIIGLFAATAFTAGMILFQLKGEKPLVWSTFALALFTATLLLMSSIWRYLDAPAQPQVGTTQAQPGNTAFEMSHAFSGGAKLAVTVQGVILGLIFALRNDGPISTTAKVGTLALTAGVVFGLLLFSVTIVTVSERPSRAVAALFFNLTLMALAYGLFCTAATVISK
ncbi:hypothetical protein [Streptomyces sp. Isolate_45]|uniref:hypothetical protein n=1 Tax=Streptomyces sp. Isolate_45 TaxID=2950111 RepID=UPI002481B9AE|nr:hypothetical protein [Streptomyces sp. Isolate_45]MDA5280913.1 hypothetical protein [Streptomyces sp. Isolate_45]